ncbi:hypothetical protein JXJ21_24015 [candidate division KSB1 bacterium]|nr:hypothetical protein [candidate division KSB1 bacterium]
MNSQLIGTRIILAVSALFIVFSAFSLNAEMSEETITGVVVATDWDDDDNVIAVSISVTIEAEDPSEESYTEYYQVANQGKGAELLKLVDEVVEATGDVEVDDDGNKTIYVKSYSVVKE